MAVKKTPARKTPKLAETAKAKPPAKKAKPAASAGVTATKKAGGPRGKADNGEAASLLARAEADMSVLLESLNSRMTAALQTFTELAVTQRGPHEAVVRTRPIDRATAVFQRLIAEVMDDRLAEMLPTLVSLRNEMQQRANMGSAGNVDESTMEFFGRGRSMLDQVLAMSEVHSYEARVGEGFDPLIHLAVGETYKGDLNDNVVGEVLQCGFRTGRGKVIEAARVKVNRR